MEQRFERKIDFKFAFEMEFRLANNWHALRVRVGSVENLRA